MEGHYSVLIYTKLYTGPPAPTNLTVGFTTGYNIEVTWQLTMVDNVDSFAIAVLSDGVMPESCTEPELCSLTVSVAMACSTSSASSTSLSGLSGSTAQNIPVSTCRAVISLTLLRSGTRYGVFVRSVNCRNSSKTIGPKFIQLRSPG